MQLPSEQNLKPGGGMLLTCRFEALKMVEKSKGRRKNSLRLLCAGNYFLLCNKAT
jgi:hypothetical protein